VPRYAEENEAWGDLLCSRVGGGGCWAGIGDVTGEIGKTSIIEQKQRSAVKCLTNNYATQLNILCLKCQLNALLPHPSFRPP